MPLQVLAISTSQADYLAIDEITRSHAFTHSYQHVGSIAEALVLLERVPLIHVILWDSSYSSISSAQHLIPAAGKLPILMLVAPEQVSDALPLLQDGVSEVVIKDPAHSYHQMIPHLLERMFHRQRSDAVWHTVEFERNLTATVYLDDGGTVRDCNQSFVDTLRYVSKSNIIGTNWADFSDIPFHTLLERLDRTNPMVGQEIDLRGSAGEVRIGVANIGRVDHPTGEGFEIRLKFIDITEWRNAEQELRLLKHAIEACTVGITVVDAQQGDFPIIYVNPAFETISGYSKEDALRKNPRFLHGDDREQSALQVIRDALQNEESCDVILKNYRSDQSPFWNSLRISPVFSESGQVTHYVGIQSDITEWRNAQESLARSEARYRAIVETQIELVGRATPDGLMTYANEAFCRYLSKTREEMIGYRFSDHVHPDDAEAVGAAFASISPQHPSFVIEHRFIMPDGSVRWQQWTNLALFDADNRLIEIQGVGRDITERKTLEDQLRYSEERYRSLIESSDHLIMMVDTNATIQFASEFTARMVNLNMDRLIGQSFCDVLPSDYANQQLSLINEVIATGEGVVIESPTRLLDQWYRTSIQPVRDASGVTNAALINITDISEIKRTEIALRDSETRLAEAQRAVLLGYWDWDITTDNIIISDEILHIFGNISNRETIRPDEFVHSIHREDRRQFLAAMRQSLQGIPFQIDLRTITKDNKLRYLHARSSKITQDEYGTVTHVFGTLQDISERKELENKLMLLNQELEQRVSERTHEVQRQVSAMDSTRAGMSLLLDGRYIYMNPAHAEMYGYKAEELIGDTWEVLYDPEEVELFKEHVFPILSTKGVWTGEVVGKRKDGSKFDAEVTLQYSSGGELICTCNDISFRKQMERQIRASEARYRVLLEQAPVALLVNNYNTDTGLYSIIYANPAAVKLLGASGAEDLIGHSAYDFMSEDSRQLSRNRISQFLGNARPGAAEYEYFRIDTREPIYLQVASIVIDFDEQPAFLSVLTDITDRRHFEMKLVASEERYRAIVESQQELICRFKPDTTLTYVNPAYCAYFDRSEEELLGLSWLNLIPAEQHASIRQHIATLIQNGGSVTYEHDAIGRDGTLQWQRWTDQVLVRGENEEIELQSVGVDITELKRVQMRLENALAKERELSELKSRFVSMTSHEFRTPLASIRATSETLRDFYDRMTDIDRRKRFERINGQIEHMAAMLDDILLIGRLEEGQITANFEYLNIGEYLRSIIEEFRSIRLTHHVIYQSEAHDLEVFADRKLIRQIFTNLLTNAAQYSSPESRIQIRLSQEDQEAVLQVIDEGIGIPDADQKHLFTAFHRAENVGNIKGTGLGLAIAKRAVELHGGSIRFTSQVGEGTTFTVRIPIEQATVMQGQRGQ